MCKMRSLGLCSDIGAVYGAGSIGRAPFNIAKKLVLPRGSEIWVAWHIRNIILMYLAIAVRTGDVSNIVRKTQGM